jgi:hypothetical protein
MAFAQPFQIQFAVVCKHDVFKIKQSFSGSKNSDFCDRCLITYSLGSVPVEWFILLEQTQPSLAPDFIFSSTPDFNPIRLTSWDIRDPESLNSMLLDLRNQLISYQKDLIKNMGNAALTFEVETLESISGSEFYFIPDQGQVHITLPLTMLVDNNLMAPSLKDFPILKTQVNLKGNTSRSYTILFPPNWSSIYPSKISDYPKFDCDLTIEYLTTLTLFWESKLKCIQYNQQFLEIFKNGFPHYVASSATSIEFMFNHGDVSAVIKLELPNDFPSSPPILTIMPFSKSEAEKQKVFKRIDDMPWSPRWKPDEVLSKVKYFIQKQLEHKEINIKNTMANLGLTNFTW